MRGRFIAAGIVVGAMLVAPAAQAVTTTIGDVAPLSTPDGMCVGCSSLQVQTQPPTPSYAVPPVPATGGPWTITSWTARGGTVNDSARLQVWRPTGVAMQYQLLAMTGDTPIVGGTATPNAVSIPVQPGDLLGLRTGPVGSVSRYHTSGVPDVVGGVLGEPSIGETAGVMATYALSTSNLLRLNVAAVLSAPDPVAPAPAPATAPASTPVTKKKCKRKRAATAKKKRCKKRRR